MSPWWLLAGVIAGAVVGHWFARRGRTEPGSPAEPQVAVAAVGTDSGLDTVLDSLAMGIVVVDADGTEMFRNAAAREFTGARHADVLVDAVVERLLTVARAGAGTEEQVQLAGPPAKVLVVQAQPLEQSGAMATITDITQQWRLDKVRTDFVANVSHELKTPVGALSVLAETIEGETEDELVLRLVNRMVQETQRMAVTIEGLLELSRIEMGEQMLVAEVDLHDVVAEVLERTNPIAAQKNVGLRLVGAGERAVVQGNHTQLLSAVGNLVDNAIKYSDEGQPVVITVSLHPEHVEVTVADSGIGIPMNSLDRIFERFYRVDRARSRGTGGTGLGLSIVRHVATNHGGEVNVTSREGEGSTFSLVVPRHRGPAGGTMGPPSGRTDNT